MKILFVAATIFEVAPLFKYLKNKFQTTDNQCFEKQGMEIYLLITGVGMVATTYQLTSFLSRHAVDIALNMGVAGSFDEKIKIGDTVNVVSEQFGDLGVEESDGAFTSLHDLDLVPKNIFPFQNGYMLNPAEANAHFLPTVKGLTVSKVHGSAESIARITNQSDAQIETMEGAAFFYVCLLNNTPFLQIRSISNRVEPRNRDNWKLELAITNLNQIIIEMVETFEM